jgi:hypothetical protein
VPRTCDQAIDDRVKIDFRVSHKNSPERNTTKNTRVRAVGLLFERSEERRR